MRNKWIVELEANLGQLDGSQITKLPIYNSIAVNWCEMRTTCTNTLLYYNAGFSPYNVKRPTTRAADPSSHAFSYAWPMRRRAKIPMPNFMHALCITGKNQQQK